jgi:hypothetical protein
LTVIYDFDTQANLPRLVRVLQPSFCVVAYVTGHVDQDRVGR